MTTATRTEADTAPRTGAPEPCEEPKSSGRTLILVAAFLAVALMLCLPVRAWLTQRAELGSLRAQNDAASARLTELLGRQERWRDNRFVAEQARERLNMVKPGEVGLIVVDPNRESTDTLSEAPPTTWYERLWVSVDSSAGRRAQEVDQTGIGARPNAPR